MRAMLTSRSRLRFVMDHNSVSGRGRDDFGGPIKASQSFRPMELAAGASFTGEVAEHTGAGLAQNRFYWQHSQQAAAALGNPQTGVRSETDEDDVSSFLIAGLGLTRDFGFNSTVDRVRDKSLDRDHRYGAYSVEGRNLALNPYPDERLRSSQFIGVHDVGSEPMGVRIAANPMPEDQPVIMVAGSERASSHVVGVAGWTGTLIADSRSLSSTSGKYSTRVADLELGRKAVVSNDLTAPIETHLRTVPTIGASSQVAWNGMASTSGEGLGGYGAMLADGSRVDREAVPDSVYTPDIGYMSATVMGPLSPGGGRGDKHFVGADRNGHSHVGGHINLQAPMYQNNFFDAPLQHSGVYIPPINEAGVMSPTFLKYDPGVGHVGVGNGFKFGARSGLHRLETLTPIWIPPEDEDEEEEDDDKKKPKKKKKKKKPLPPVPGGGRKPTPPPPPPEQDPPFDPEQPGSGFGVNPGGEDLVLPPGGEPIQTPGRETQPIDVSDIEPLLDPSLWSPTGEPFGGFWEPVPGDLGTPPGPSLSGVSVGGLLTPEEIERRREIAECTRPPLAPQIVTDDTISGVSSYMQSNAMTATPGILFAPVPADPQTDYRFVARPDPCTVAMVRDAPITAHIVPFGDEDDNGRWVYAADPIDGAQFRSGTTNGGIAVFPPTESLDGRATAPESVPDSSTYFVLKAPASGRGVALGFGCPKQTGTAAGKVHDGFVFRRGSEGLTILKTDSDGVESGDAIATFTSEYAQFNSPQQNTAAAETADFDAAAGHTHEVDVTAGAVTVSLPDEDGIKGQRVTIVSQVDASTKNITITSPYSASGQIGDTDSYILSADYASVTFEATSWGWVVVGCSC